MGKRTPLYDWHRSHGARMVDFAGWEMPLQYSGIVQEHLAVRSQAGIFDLSHMGEIRVEGSAALPFLQRVTTNDVSRLQVGQVQYSLLCQPDGGILDDLLVYRDGPAVGGTEGYWLVVNAANQERDGQWLRSQAENPAAGPIQWDPGALRLANLSDGQALIGVQGPQSEAILLAAGLDVAKELQYYHFAYGQLLGARVLVARTGYTGEDGFELMMENSAALPVWELLMEKGRAFGLVPAGLGARDTLRLEMKYTLYGNDIDTHTNPLEAGLGWVVAKDKGPFVGKEAIEAVRQQGVRRRLVAIRMQEAGIPRPHYALRAQPGGEVVGQVTSGTFSPSLNTGIAMGYVPVSLAKPGTALWVDLRGRDAAARVVPAPFVPSHVRKG